MDPFYLNLFLRISPMTRTILSCGWWGMPGGLDWNSTSLITLTCPLMRYVTFNIDFITFIFQDSGFYVLGKFANEEKTEIHLTAFKVLNHLYLISNHFTLLTLTGSKDGNSLHSWRNNTHKQLSGLYTIFSSIHFDMMWICKKAPGELCCLRGPSQNTNLSNKEINLALIYNFPLELIFYLMLNVLIFLYSIIKESSIFQSFRGR